MILTPEQQAGWQVELDQFNAQVTRSNQAVDEHNALLPEGVPHVEKQPLLTLEEFVTKRLNEIAEAGRAKQVAASKNNEQWMAEWQAMKVQLDAVEADKETIEAARLQLVADLAAMTTERNAALGAKSQAEATIEIRDATVAVLESDKALLATQLAEANSSIASLQSQVNILTESVFSLQETVSSLESERQASAIQLAAVQSELDALKATIWDVRKIDPRAWQKRFGDDAVRRVAILAATDAFAFGLVKALDDAIALRKDDPNYLMDLDHPNIKQGIPYLASKTIRAADGETIQPVLSEADVARLTADSRRDEQ